MSFVCASVCVCVCVRACFLRVLYVCVKERVREKGWVQAVLAAGGAGSGSVCGWWSNWHVLQRTGSNLLINNQGQLKLADFGLARPFDTDQPRTYTNRVITLWYRPPELLLGATTYGTAIDMWSAGCIFAELLVKKPILPGRNEFEQLELIFKLLGMPTEASWPACTELQYYSMIMGQMKRNYTSKFQEKFGQ